MIGKAHQRIVREKVANSGEEIGLFGAWWNNLDLSPSAATVRLINHKTAAEIIKKYEWMGCMSAITWFSYGLYFEGNCAGVVCYGSEYSENLGKICREKGMKCADWSKYGYEGKMILLNRGACVHWAPDYAASFLIRRSMAMLPKKYEVVTSTTDPLAGEIGTVYQAAGFHYVGSMRDENKNVKSKKMDRDGWMIEGKLYGARSVRAMCGSTKLEDIRLKYPLVEKVKQSSKRRYFAFRGSKKAKKAHLKAIEGMIKDYPKRVKSQERDANDQLEG